MGNRPSGLIMRGARLHVLVDTSATSTLPAICRSPACRRGMVVIYDLAL